MNINHFRYAIAVAEHANMTKAAKALYISQPALTRSISQLEEQMGVKLFERDTTPICPTCAGSIFLQEAYKIVKIYDELQLSMHSFSVSEQGRLVLGIPGERGAFYLPLLLPAFAKLYPNVDVQIVEAHNSQLEERMEDGEIDLSIYTMPVASSSIDYEIIQEEPILIVCGRECEFARQFDLSENSIYTPYYLTPQQLGEQDFLLVTKGSGMRRLSEFIMELHNIRYRVRRELYRHETVVRLAAAGDGFAITSCITPTRLDIQDQLAYFTLDNPPLTRKIIIGYKKYRAFPGYMKDFIHLSREIVNTPGKCFCENVTVIPAVLQQE